MGAVSPTSVRREPPTNGSYPRRYIMGAGVRSLHPGSQSLRIAIRYPGVSVLLDLSSRGNLKRVSMVEHPGRNGR